MSLSLQIIKEYVPYDLSHNTLDQSVHPHRDDFKELGLFDQ